MPAGQGGPPITDDERFAALRGEFATANTENAGDYAVLVSCGPFSRLEPGQSVSFAVALAGVSSADSVAATAFEARLLYRGTRLNSQPDQHAGGQNDYLKGNTGVNGHEICLEPPPGVVFDYDPHCPEKFGFDPLLIPPKISYDPHTIATQITYRSGQCIWTDLDCDVCTGDDGVDEVRHWELDMRLPPRPATRSLPGDHRVTIAWDNGPELTIASGSVGASNFKFAGYKVYRLDDWSRESLLPGPEHWQRLGVYRQDPAQGGTSLAQITDPSLPSDGDRPGGAHYPVGRYHVDDARALDGFDYQYLVTTIMREDNGPSATLPPREFESPFSASRLVSITPRRAFGPSDSFSSTSIWTIRRP